MCSFHWKKMLTHATQWRKTLGLPLGVKLRNSKSSDLLTPRVALVTNFYFFLVWILYLHPSVSKYDCFWVEKPSFLTYLKLIITHQIYVLHVLPIGVFVQKYLSFRFTNHIQSTDSITWWWDSSFTCIPRKSMQIDGKTIIFSIYIWKYAGTIKMQKCLIKSGSSTHPVSEGV